MPFLALCRSLSDVPLALLQPSAVLMAACFLTLSFGCSGDAVVVQPPAPVEVSVAPSSLNLNVGYTAQLTATVRGSTDTTVTWRTTPPNIALLTPTGEVTAIAPGTALVVAIANADTSRRATAFVTVTNTMLVIALLPATATISVGQTRRFTAVPANWLWTWRTSHPSIASIDTTGLATAIASGTTVITALPQSDSTKRVSAILTVLPPNSRGTGERSVIAARSLRPYPCSTTTRLAESIGHWALYTYDSCRRLFVLTDPVKLSGVGG